MARPIMARPIMTRTDESLPPPPYTQESARTERAADRIEDTMTPTELYDMTVAERRRLEGLLSGLTPAQWAADSLCRGWRTREVVAHLISTELATLEEFEASVAAADGDIDLACDRAARADAARLTDEELLEIYRRRVPSRWTPGPQAHQAALAHEVIHGLDLTVALGLPGPAPEVIAAAMSGSNEQAVAYFGVDLSRTRLVADDVALAVGADGADGVEEIRMTAIEVTLVATGRAPVPQRSAAAG